MKRRFFTILLLCSAVCSVKADEVDTTKVYQIDDVVVTAYRSKMPLRDAPNKVEVITSRDLKSIPAINVTDLIKKSSNSDAVDMQGVTGGIDFRGYAPSAAGTNSYTRLLVDGIPMSTRNSSAISLSNISSIEIMKGPFSAIYGSGAMGGVINIVTPQTQGKLQGSVTGGFGSFNTAVIAAALGGNIIKKLDFDIYFDLHNQNKDYKTGGHNILKMTDYEKQVMDKNSYSKIYSNTRYDRKSGGVRLGYDINDKWRVNLFNDIYYTGRGQGNGMLWGMYEQTDKKIFRNAHRIDLTGEQGIHTLRFSPYFSHESSDYDNDFGYMKSKSRYNYNTWGAVIQDIIKIGRQRIIFGVDNFSQKYTSNQWKEDGSLDAPFQPNYANIQTGVFAQANLSFFDNKLTSIVGLRYDNIMFKTYSTPLIDMSPDDKNYNTVNPNFAIKYKILPSIAIRASIGSAFLAPDAFKMTGDYTVWGTLYKGNSSLKPEKSTTYDVALSFNNKKKSISADITLFNTDHKNLIINDYSNTDYVTYKNANSAKVSGLEYMLSVDFGRMMDKNYSLRLYAYYTHIFRSDVKTMDISSEKKYISRNNANFGIDFIHGKFSARINGRYIGQKLEDNWIYATDYTTFERYPFQTKDGVAVRPSLINDNTVRLPDFMIFDLFADYSFTKNLNLGLKLANILDENYMERDGYYMPGRNFSVQVSFKF